MHLRCFRILLACTILLVIVSSILLFGCGKPEGGDTAVPKDATPEEIMAGQDKSMMKAGPDEGRNPTGCE